MIDSIRSYYENKSKIEKIIFEGDLFDDVVVYRNPISQIDSYPITASKDGVSLHIDEYRCYVNLKILIVFNNLGKLKINRFQNLKLSHFNKSVKYIHAFLDGYKTNNISGMNLIFNIPTTCEAKYIIETNILMCKYKYYNHNITQNNKKLEVKEFVFTNYTIGFYAVKKGENQSILKVSLKLNKSSEFRKFGILNPLDVLKKDALKALFELFIKRFDELIIIDNYENIEEKDSALLKQFLNYRYWVNLNKNNSRQTLYRKRNKFKTLIIKYDLNTQKLNLKKELYKAFNEFIKN